MQRRSFAGVLIPIDLEINATFWENEGQHGQESEEGKEDSQEDGQEEKEVIVRRNLIAFG